MTEAVIGGADPPGTPDLPERPSPAAAFAQRFEQIRIHQMHDVPIVNPALRVQAVGFRPWRDHWLGVLVTPWFMNLVLAPRLAAAWPATRPRESRQHVVPGGVFEFIAHHDAVLGEYLACSLLSPMFDFADARAAQDTAAAALVALFDAGGRLPADPPMAEPAPAAAVINKRDFLFGPLRSVRRGP